MTDLYLWVDNEDSTGAWNTYGSAPYLDAQDSTNYIDDSDRNNDSGVYSFQASGKTTETINSVTLYMYAWAGQTADFEAILGATATGLNPPTSPGWVSIDVSSILTTWTEIDAATVYFDRSNNTRTGGVDGCYLLVDYTEAATQVNKDLQVVYDIDNLVNKDIQAVWDLDNLVNKDLQMVYDLFSLVNKDIQVVYDIDILVNKDLQMLWDMSGAVYKDLQVVWDLLNLVNKDLQVDWDILNLVSKDIQAVWDLDNLVNKDLQMVWDMSGIVGKQLQADWDILNIIADDIQMVWDILNLTNKDLQMDWDIGELVNKDIQVVYDIEQSSGSVYKDLQIVWDLNGEPVAIKFSDDEDMIQGYRR
jgi:hypothetical protein